jgi:hypothetical protein
MEVLIWLMSTMRIERFFVSANWMEKSVNSEYIHKHKIIFKFFEQQVEARTHMGMLPELY